MPKPHTLMRASGQRAQTLGRISSSAHSMASSLPLASTEQGVSGLDLVEGLDYLGGQTAASLADSVVRLLQFPEAAAPMGEAGRAYVRRAHDWSVAASQLEQVPTVR